MDPQAPPDQKCEPRGRKMGTASLQNRRIAQVLEVDQCGVYKQLMVPVTQRKESMTKSHYSNLIGVYNSIIYNQVHHMIRRTRQDTSG